MTPDRTLDFPAGHTSDDDSIPVSEPISGLEPNTTYHYRVCTSPGIEEGSRGCTSEDRNFTTAAAGGRTGIAFASSRNGNLDIYAMDADGSDPTRLTNNAASDTAPAWSPDATKIAFTATAISRSTRWTPTAPTRPT